MSTPDRSGVPRTTWGAGDYPALAHRLTPAAETAVRLAAVVPGERVLDVACGTGNAALAAAARGARVTGVDAEPALLALAAERAARARVQIDWREADAVALGEDDGAYDAVLSVFGVMYALRHEDAAAELARVCAPGGRVVLAAWSPRSLMPAIEDVLAPYIPDDPEQTGPAAAWGERDGLRALLARHGLQIEQEGEHAIALGFPSREDAVGFLVATAGHVVAERERLQSEGRWEGLEAELGDVVTERSVPAGTGVAFELPYLLVRASRG